MVNIALEDTGTTRCLPGDANGDGHITVDEIILGVVNALVGCPTPASVTPATFTPTPTSVPGNQTPGTGSVPRRAAGTTVAVSQGLRALPLVLSSITQLAGGGGAAARRDSGAAAVQNCSGGGTRDFVCTQTLPTAPPRNYTLMFNSCNLNTAGGSSVALQGTITGQSTETGPLAICSFPPTTLSTLTLNNVSVVAKNAAAVTTLSAQFNFTGSLSVTPDLLSACKVSGFTMMLNGTVDVQSGALTETLTFNNTSIKLDITQFSSSCVPVVYRMTVNGDASFSSPSLGSALSGMFTNFVFSDNTASGSDLVMIDGQLNSACLGTVVSFSTPMALSIAPGMVCPSAGAVLVSAGGNSDKLNYTPTGGVDIDLGNNTTIDEMISSCLDPQLYACP